jgi:hypothetical protein
MEESLSGLVRSLKGVRGRAAGNRPRYGAALRRRCLAYLKAARAEGRSVMEVAAKLGLPAGTLHRWQVEPGAEKQGGVRRRTAAPKASKAAVKAAAAVLRPVVVMPEDGAPTPREIAVESPSGYRLTGLTLCEGAWVLGMLGLEAPLARGGLQIREARS